MNREHLTSKIVLTVVHFFQGVLALPWCIITYFMITQTLHGENTASICVPIGIAMALLTIGLSIFLLILERKIFEKKINIFLCSFIPFVVGIILFTICAFIGLK